MRFLFDQNLSPRLVGRLAVDFPGSEHVRNIGMSAAPDPALWKHAAANDFAIVSKDAATSNAEPCSTGIRPR